MCRAGERGQTRTAFRSIENVQQLYNLHMLAKNGNNCDIVIFNEQLKIVIVENVSQNFTSNIFCFVHFLSITQNIVGMCECLVSMIKCNYW